MPRLLSLRVKRLRSLLDTGDIEIKPITVLVGKNSAGKSTFARVFPLLAQSLKEGKRGPIIWFGRYVDFGSFDDAVSRQVQKDPAATIEFNFRVELDYDSHQSGYARRARRPRLLGPTEVLITLSISRAKARRGTFASLVRVSGFESNCEFHLTEQGEVSAVRMNGRVIPIATDVISRVAYHDLLPNISFLRKRDVEDDEEDTFVFVDVFRRVLRQAIKSVVHGNTDDDTINRIANALAIGTPQQTLHHMRSRVQGPASWQESVSHMTVSTPSFVSIREALLLSQWPVIITACDDQLKNFFSGVSYSMPVRATAQRDYRQTDVGVSEIESDGSNVAMFLDSLNDSDKVRLRAWMVEMLGFEVETRATQGMTSIFVRQGNANEFTNIADMGFGFSQLIPIAVQMWLMTERTRREDGLADSVDRTRCLVIEQPELHLHPDFQARLGNLFAHATRASGGARFPLKIVAETHSPSLIHRLGDLVARGELESGDVQIVLFDHDEEKNSSVLRIAKFDADGVLTNWPYGFFEASPN